MTSVQIARSPLHYSFVCKQGQQEQVMAILGELGMSPSSVKGTYLRACWRSDGVMVYAVLNGHSKRSIDRAMFAAGISGARDR